MKKVILYLVLFATALVFKMNQMAPEFVVAMIFALSFGLAGLHVFELLMPASKEKKQQSYSTKFVFVVVLLALAIVNVLARKFEKVYDLSSLQQYSFREQTVEWLKKINEPIEIFVFVSSDPRLFGYAEWLQTQAKKHTSHLTVSIKNINKEIVLAEKYGVKNPGEVVVISGNQWSKVENFTEKNIVTGIVRVLNKTSASLCFIEGHGEPHALDQAEGGIKNLYNHFLSIGYKVRSIRLEAQSAEAVSKECQLVVLFTPQTALLPDEQETLTKIAQTKTPMWIGLERPIPDSLDIWMQNQGMKWSEGYILDQAKVEKHELGRDLNFRPRDKSELAGVLKTSIYMSGAYALQNLENNSSQIQYTPSLSTDTLGRYELVSSDEKQPYVICWQGVRDQEPVRYVCGQSAWMTNKNLQYGDNRNAAVAIVQWLLGEASQGWVQQPLPEEPPISLTDSEMVFVKIASLYGIPGLVFVLSFGYWFQRRWKA